MGEVTELPPRLPIAKVMLERDLSMDALNVHVLTSRDDRGYTVMRPLVPPVLMTHGMGDAPDRVPAFKLDYPSAQAFFDAMWDFGLRPSGASATTAANEALVKAMQAHIDDLRVVAQVVKPADQPASGAGSF